MKIAIIGAGSVGGALAKGWSAQDHDIILGVRDPALAKYTDLAAQLGAVVALPAEAVAQSDVVVLATPWPATKSALEGLGDLEGRPLIDCTNPLAMTANGLGLECGFSTSGGEQVADWAPTARVVKTLNQVGAEVMANSSGFCGIPVMFVAGDDEEAKATVSELVAELGFAPQDAGALRMARLLEPLAMVWINQAVLRGKGRDWAFGAMVRHTGTAIKETAG